MTIAGTNLTSGGSAPFDSTTFTTASISPTSGSVLFFALWSTRGAGAAAPVSLTGNSTLTLSNFAVVDTRLHAGASDIMCSVVRCTHNAGTGTVTITFTNAHDVAAWAIDEVTDLNTTTPTVQSVDNGGVGTGTGFITAACTLAAFGSASNGVWAAGFCSDRAGVPVAGSGFTLLGNYDWSGSFSVRIGTEIRADNDTSPDMQMGQNASTDSWSFIGVEVAAVSGGPIVPHAMLLGVG